MQFHSSVNCLLILGAITAVGVLFGWLVGASASPVVAGVLPLIFGLVGGLIAPYLSRQFSIGKVEAGLPPLTNWMLTFWAVAVVVFVVATYRGIERGMDRRVGGHRPLSDVLQRAGIDIENVDDSQWLAMQNALLRLRRLGASDEELDEIFRYGIRPKLEGHSQEIVMGTENLFSGLDGASFTPLPASPARLATPPVPPPVPLDGMPPDDPPVD